MIQWYVSMFFPPRCWMQCRKSLFDISTHMPDYSHLNYIFIEFQKLSCIFFFCCVVLEILSMSFYSTGTLKDFSHQFLHANYDQDDAVPLSASRNIFIVFLCLHCLLLVPKHHLHLSLHGKKNRPVLSTLLEKTSGSP